jgi:hypothetical protein
MFLFCSHAAHGALTKSPQAIIKAVKFQPVSELDDAEQALMSYKRLHRFYPTFYAIGIQ